MSVYVRASGTTAQASMLHSTASNMTNDASSITTIHHGTVWLTISIHDSFFIDTHLHYQYAIVRYCSRWILIFSHIFSD